MKPILFYFLVTLLPALTGYCEEHFDQAASKPEPLIQIIHEQQRRYVRESFGELEHECFTDDDLARFVSDQIPAKIAQELKGSRRFLVVVATLRQMPIEEREKLLRACRRPLHPTWRQLGRISREGQTEAGQKAERLIAEAIVNLVRRALR